MSKEEKKEEEDREKNTSSAATTKKEAQLEERRPSKESRTSPIPSRSHATPIITNAVPNRPPSAASVHSTNSSGPRSTTATSRRGGRTRSRSPPMMSSRPPSTGPAAEPYSTPDDRRPPPSPANPSAAAAAAAAAAKSITRHPPPPASWYESPASARERDYRRARVEPPRYHPRFYEGGPPPRPHWGPEDEQDGGIPPRARCAPPRRPMPDDRYGFREGYAAYHRSRPSRGEPYPPQFDEEYERRYADPRFGLSRQSPMPHDYRGHPGNPRDPYFPRGPQGARADGGAPPMVKRTTRVIGGPTPIHVPRAPDSSGRPSSARSSSQPDSIFRGRPGTDPPKPLETEDTQKVLMSLRTPSNSFEEKEDTKEATQRNDALSPEAPPKIQHSHHQSDSLFDPQRSPKNSTGTGPPQPTSSLDMAPSFTLFNQSFDSIGDTANFFNVSGPLDSALQSSSFGAMPSASKDDGPDLQLTNSVGNFSQQLLGGSTFEMSPNNSFGNGPSVSRSRSGNMMVLGGADRPASPSQVLEMYGSYGGPYPGPRMRGGPPTDEGNIRRGAPSMPAPTLSNTYRGPYGEVQPIYRSRGHPEMADGSPGFYIYLRRHKDAFKDCTFLLPGLKSAVLGGSESSKEEVDDTPKRHTRSGYAYDEVDPNDVAIAKRRVISAVCAFGGTCQEERTSNLSKPHNSHSIFREKPDEVATVTPNSSAGTTASYRSRQRAKYDELLPSRYYENDNRLSWEFEESPPIDEMGREEEEADERKREEEQNGKDTSSGDGEHKGDDEDDEGGEDGDKKGGTGKDGDQGKMRYRCKLCGQPKQNHTCPYQQSLARSIGTMVYPAVNAFTASEPGSLAPALSEMNNFISSGDSVASNDIPPSHPTPERMRRLNGGASSGTAQVTPETLRGGTPRAGSSPTNTPQRAVSSTPHRGTRPGLDMQRRYLGTSHPPSSVGRGKKRGHGQMLGDDQADLLFVEAIDLKPEQYRIVTVSKIVSSSEAFTYPALPLPYAQRKRLSDNLFSLSKEVPQLTDECASVLREAREKDMWDLAVAELMTQVVVVVHCHDADSRFEGLRRYLMTLGISC